MAEFIDAKTMSVSMNVNVTADGNIAQTGDIVGGVKALSIQGIKKGATLAQSKTVFDIINTTLGGGVHDTLSAVRKITEGVA